MRKLSIEEVIKQVKDIHGDNISLVTSSYKDTHTKCIFIDKQYGEFISTPNRITNGGGHPERKKETLRQLYKLSEDEINFKIKDFAKVNYSSYQNNLKECEFIDHEFGIWWALPCHVFRQRALHPQRSDIKRKTTNMSKYGCNNPSQNKDVGLKQAMASNKMCILTHWKTGKDVICIASYEKAVVEYFNKEKIDFEWQPMVFEMPNGRTYRPDIYLPLENKWIEVKGYFRNRAKEKWEWFHKEYPNSELWNREKLKELHIL